MALTSGEMARCIICGDHYWPYRGGDRETCSKCAFNAMLIEHRELMDRVAKLESKTKVMENRDAIYGPGPSGYYGRNES